MIYITRKMFNANGNYINNHPELRGVEPIFNEIKIPKYNPPKEDTLGSLVIGGLIHKEVRRRIRHLLKPGCDLLNLTRNIEKETIELSSKYNTINKGIGFPAGLAVNECAAHWAPSNNTKIELGPDDVIKIDFGVEINGWIVDSAFTVSFNHKYDNLLTAVKEATNYGIKHAGIDVDIREWSQGIGEIMESYDINLNGEYHRIRAIENLGGHNILNGIIHGGMFLPPKNLGNRLPSNYRFKEGVYAIETFGSTGSNISNESGKATLFRINPDNPLIINSDEGLQNFNKKILSSFKTLPFCDRYVSEFDKNYDNYLTILTKNDIIKSYPPLLVKKGEYTAQYEHTIYLQEGKKVVCSQGEDY